MQGLEQYAMMVGEAFLPVKELAVIMAE